MEQFAELLREAAVVLGTEAARLWPQIVLVTFVKALASLIGLVFLFICISALFMFGRGLKDENDKGTIYLGGTILLAVFIMIAIVGFPNICAGIFAPEGQTALNIINGLR